MLTMLSEESGYEGKSLSFILEFSLTFSVVYDHAVPLK